MAQSLFTSQTPTTTDASDGVPAIATATTVRFAVSGSVTGIRFYATTTVGGAETYTARLWQVTGPDAGGIPGGTPLATKAVLGAAITPGDWNTIVFDAPVLVVPNTLYRAVLHNSAGRYVAIATFFVSDLVNGDITADANGDNPVGLGTLRQGTFTIDSDPHAYPSTQPGQTCYLVDVVFVTEEHSGTADPAALTVDLDVAGGKKVTTNTDQPLSVELDVAGGKKVTVATLDNPLIVSLAVAGSKQPYKRLNEGPVLLRSYITSYLAATMPVLVSKARVDWGLTDEQLPDITQYDGYDLPSSNNQYPLIGVYLQNDTGYDRSRYGDAMAEEYWPSYQASVAVWVLTPRSGTSWETPTRDTAIRLRDHLANLTVQALLSRPSLGQEDCTIEETRLQVNRMEPYKLNPESNLWVAGAYIPLSYRMRMDLWRVPLGTANTITTVVNLDMPTP